ncbi:GDSL-type esterase/lipase family protein [Rhizobium sp. 32-5/1]|uniref:GDSL-type esterase/lipase family protein n=1 Tax=Rhizobium sp. 32-5/1 TaxID=3019602 RepID=UPI00240E2355|nr:GDSL-type esterase/lipase family protein [Rhizobium sp. 32-5/1]WEZ84634.1 GDSL-type esterase/lipase family protein [Rhizobium sp. 32-5/1]
MAWKGLADRALKTVSPFSRLAIFLGTEMRKALCYSVVLMCLLNTLAAAEGECDPVQIRVSTTPVIEQSPGRLKRAIDVRKVQGPNPDLLLVGDSLVQQWQPHVSRDFPGRAVHNFGVGGDKTQEVLWRLRNMKPKVSPREIVVLIGTNNLADKSATPCGVSGGIEAVVEEIGYQWPEAFTFVVQLLPRGEHFEFRSQERREVNNYLAKRFAGSGTAAFVEVDEGKISCSWNSRNCSMFRPDLLHLQADGYGILRQALRQTSIELFDKDRLNPALTQKN